MLELKYPKVQQTGKTVNGRAEFILLEDFSLSISMGSSEYTYFIAKDTTTDFGSVPRLLWFIVNPLDPQFVVGFLIHDDLYSNKNISRFFADSVLRYIGGLYGASTLKQLAVYYAVRMGAHSHFKRKQSIISSSVYEEEPGD